MNQKGMLLGAVICAIFIGTACSKRISKDELRELLMTDDISVLTNLHSSIIHTDDIVDLVRDTNETVSIMAMQYLGRRTEADAVPILVSQLANPSWRIRFFAVQSLGRFRDGTVEPDLLALVQTEEYWQVQRELSIALVLTRATNNIAELEERYRNSDGRIKACLGVALYFVGTNSESRSQYFENIKYDESGDIRRLVNGMITEIEVRRNESSF